MQINNLMFITYYKQTDHEFRCWSYHEDLCYDLNKLPSSVSNFYLPKNSFNYTACDEDLRKYGLQLLKERNEILLYSKFDYIAPTIYSNGKIVGKTHSSNIEFFFNLNCRNNEYYQKHETISKIEHQYMSKCNNGGLTYIKEGIHDSWGYDYKRFYQSIMTDENFIIPFKEGQEKKLKIIPKNIVYILLNIVRTLLMIYFLTIFNGKYDRNIIKICKIMIKNLLFILY